MIQRCGDIIHRSLMPSLSSSQSLFLISPIVNSSRNALISMTTSSESYYRHPSIIPLTPLPSSLINVPPPTMRILWYRQFHSTSICRSPKKRRLSSASVRKRKVREMAKEQRSKALAANKINNNNTKSMDRGGAKKKTKADDSSRSHRPRSRIPRLPDPIAQKGNGDGGDVMVRAFLSATGSKYAYVAKCAIMDEVEEGEEVQMHVDPMSLFAGMSSDTRWDKGGRRIRHVNKLSDIFRQSHLQYFHPSSFPNHEPPTNGIPEVAFLGRSNTGKSSLINALSNLIGGGGGSSTSGGGELARTSKRPGRTQTVNYFGLISNEVTQQLRQLPSSASSSAGNAALAKQSKLYLVDLPGFGYASAPDANVDEWQERTQQFLISRATMSSSSSSVEYRSHRQSAPPLKRLYLLLDSRLPDVALLDLTVMGWCDEYSIPYTIVLTKVDGTSRAMCAKLTNKLCMRYHSLYMDANRDDKLKDNADDETDDGREVYMDPVVYWTSSKDGLGMEELLLSVGNSAFAVEDVYDDYEYATNDDEEEDDIKIDKERRPSK